jgi:hypothetical protein
MTLEKVSTEPMERSIPAVRMTTVSPMARMTRRLATRRTFSALVAVKNTGEAMVRMTHREPGQQSRAGVEDAGSRCHPRGVASGLRSLDHSPA